jgi:hypothetical protein
MKRKKMTGIDDPSRELEAALEGLAKVEMVYSIPGEELKRKLVLQPNVHAQGARCRTIQ